MTALDKGSLDMTSEEVITNVRYRQNIGEEMGDRLAATVASYFHSGQGSAFYAFSSSGHYDREALLAELSSTIQESYIGSSADDRLMLDMLGTYFLNRGDSR